ncbi:histidine phosphatase superfamily branch 1 protein [Nitzschia inconspicua]|uniref:Histidine phosphatase superfamily branch 1 protein n=1 Tax=Nitzschia inconspicua TaxID=303405 RepID=A0A9K3KU72_9STRA|nr:histidine phosphatase superfamily branch 1 protein [Nitzschia inconspicua]
MSTPISTSSEKDMNTNEVKKKKKRLLCIRHGISVANEWMQQPGNQWGDATFCDDPTLVDAKLSETGRLTSQTVLQRQLNDNPLLHKTLQQVELILVSPLTRCLETFQYGVEPLLLNNNNNNHNSNSHDDNNSNNNGRSSSSTIPTLAVPLICERVYTISDTGRSVGVLKQEFPHINFDECCPSEPWWYTGQQQESRSDETTLTTTNATTTTTNTTNTNPDSYKEWRPFGQGQWYAVPGEPLQVFEERLQRFDEWLAKRPETTILIVAHWGVLRHLAHEQDEWTNAEAKVLDWEYCTESLTRTVAVAKHQEHQQK